MTLIPWRRPTLITTQGASRDPFVEFQQQFNSLFDDFFGASGQTPAKVTGFAFAPPLDVSETEKQVVVRAELPGLESKDVTVSIHDNVLTLRGEKKTEKKEEKENYFRSECSYGAFTRSVALPADVDADHAEATMNKGVLTLTLPKVSQTKAKTITVK